MIKTRIKSTKTPWLPATGHRPHSLPQLAFAMIVLLLVAGTGQGQVVRTFVSTTGSDAGPCSRTQPCRTFGTAIAAVDAAGEVVALDSGGYGPFVVTRSVTISAPAGVHAAIAPTTGNAVTVQAAVTDEVSMRGLYINSQGASVGVAYTGGEVLHLDRTLINGFSSIGISVSRSVGNQDGALFLSDSIVRGNDGTGLRLVSTDTTSTLRAMIDNCRFEANQIGVEVQSVSVVVMVGSVVSANWDGVLVSSSIPDLAGRAFLTVERCFISNNAADGLSTRTGAGTPEVWISGSAVTDNSVGLREAAGNLRTLGNNTVTGNMINNVVGTLNPFTAF